MNRIIDASALASLAARACSGAACGCLKHDLRGWAHWPVGYREEDFRKIGTLQLKPVEDCTLDEYHPQATIYWSAEAPIAPAYYPYNQSSVWECVHCQRAYLRHDDDGAYHVAPRIRLVQAGLVVEADPAQGAP
ncbi:hypothetical protein [Pseudomonas sp. DC3000-4b1]|uniref:hypothetical protein n=1 Tax=unclassified Pseudomonas TaxID=196821 RepID=UPI003CFBAC0C